MTKATTEAKSEATAEATFEDTLQHYSFAPLVELAMKLAGHVKVAKSRRAGVASPQVFDSIGQHRLAELEQAQQAKPVLSPGID